MIIGISGKIGHGKDTVASLILYHIHKEKIETGEIPLSVATRENFLHNPNIYKSYLGWEVHRFAGKLKEIVALLTGIPVHDLGLQEVKDKELPECWHKTVYHVKWGEITLISTHYKETAEVEKDFYSAIFPNLSIQEEFVKPTVRYLLQNIGAEAMRDVIHTNVWCNALFTSYLPRSKGSAPEMLPLEERVNHNMLYYHGHCKNCQSPFYGYKLQPFCYDCIKDESFQIYPNWVIPDLRFPNEYEGIKQRNGLLLRVERDQSEAISYHPSETSLDNHEFDYVIKNNGTLDELSEKVKEILIKEKIIKQ